MRTGRKKLDADARALFRYIAQIDDAALLLFLGRGIDENKLGADHERVIEIQQASMRVDRNGLLFARNFSPSTFFPFTYTGMRVKTRELRRSVACVSGITSSEQNGVRP